MGLGNKKWKPTPRRTHHSSILHSNSQKSETRWNLLNLLELAETCRSLLQFAKTCWNSLRLDETSWDLLKIRKTENHWENSLLFPFFMNQVTIFGYRRRGKRMKSKLCTFFSAEDPNAFSNTKTIHFRSFETWSEFDALSSIRIQGHRAIFLGTVASG